VVVLTPSQDLSALVREAVAGGASWFGPHIRNGWGGRSTSPSPRWVYLYPRLLLTAINGTGFFVAMVAVGLPVGLAIRSRSSCGPERYRSRCP
jgi:hypothetical protein